MSYILLALITPLITDFRNSQIVILSMQSKDNATDMWPDKHYNLLTVLIMLCVLTLGEDVKFH